MEPDIKSDILDTITDLASNFLYYDRKESDLRVGMIEEAVKLGYITVDDMVNKFREELEKSCK